LMSSCETMCISFACIGNSNAILPMTTGAGVPPFHSGGTHA
jgi:hypothetical protein